MQCINCDHYLHQEDFNFGHCSNCGHPTSCYDDELEGDDDFCHQCGGLDWFDCVCDYDEFDDED